MDGYCDVKRVSVGTAVRVPPHVAHTDLDIYYNNNLVRLKGESGEVCLPKSKYRYTGKQARHM